jgi:undecaprenyl-diphosphatase
MTTTEAIIIAIVEGITEYLPVSSTGHMIIASSALGIQEDDFTKLFTVAIQLGAILAVVVLYWKRFFDLKNLNFYFKLIFGVVPALVFGFFFADKVDDLLESPTTVAISLLLGGFVLLFIDRYFQEHTTDDINNVTPKQAMLTGIWQCLAMIPGVSRSAASIIGGMQQGMTRKLAAEFSFFLAVPTMFAATSYKLFKGYEIINKENLNLLLIGNVVAFIVAIIAIKFFIGFLQKYGFRLFGWYRIIAGIILLILIYSGAIAH